LEARGCHVVFAPNTNDIYPEDYHTYILVKGLDQKLCGAFRHGHFRGVATIVAKLFNITRCHVAVFGRKDYQQALILKRMVLDLNMDVRILTAPIVREPDGLAMSSRNAYLPPEERAKATVLNQSLKLAEHMVNDGETDCDTIKQAMINCISEPRYTKIDYVSLVDPITLEDKTTVDSPVLAAVAVHVGPARLIDNRLLNSDRDDIFDTM
jgi:pantoate--beta-alanine ligase